MVSSFRVSGRTGPRGTSNWAAYSNSSSPSETVAALQPERSHAVCTRVCVVLRTIRIFLFERWAEGELQKRWLLAKKSATVTSREARKWVIQRLWRS